MIPNMNRAELSAPPQAEREKSPACAGLAPAVSGTLVKFTLMFWRGVKMSFAGIKEY